MGAFLCYIPLLLSSVIAQSRIVEIPNGKLLGSYNGEFYSFTNIPFAQAPVGLNRFEAPLPYTANWSGVRDATAPSVACVGFSQSLNVTNGVEDCLIVNVHTPNPEPGRRYPVRLYLHAGGFMVGNAGELVEDFVVRRNIVLVIPNWRVGPFGFLSSGTDLVSGNFGLKDQQLAMKWVQENIHLFGGDPNRVLLAGVFSGGASAHLHLLNPKSWKYFNSALSSSGASLCPWVMQPNPEEQFRKYIGHLKCENTSPLDVKRCLQSRTKEEHFLATMALKDKFNDNPFNVLGVVVEAKSVHNPFITEHPYVLIQRGQISNVPWIVSHGKREGDYTASEFLGYDDNGVELIEILNSRWQELAPIILYYNNTCVGCSPEKAKEFRDKNSKRLRRKYLRNEKFAVGTYLLLEKMFTNVLFVKGIEETINLHRRFGPAPVYAYEYRNPLDFSIGNVLSRRNDLNFGADHGSDQSLVIPLRYLYRPNDTFTDNDRFIGENLIEMGKELSISGLAKYDSRLIPANTPTQTGKLTIYETYYVIESVINGEYSIQTYNNPPYKAGYFYGIGH